MNIFALTIESLIKKARPRILVLYIYVHIHEPVFSSVIIKMLFTGQEKTRL